MENIHKLSGTSLKTQTQQIAEAIIYDILKFLYFNKLTHTIETFAQECFQKGLTNVLPTVTNGPEDILFLGVHLATSNNAYRIISEEPLPLIDQSNLPDGSVTPRSEQDDHGADTLIYKRVSATSTIVETYVEAGYTEIVTTVTKSDLRIPEMMPSGALLIQNADRELDRTSTSSKTTTKSKLSKETFNNSSKQKLQDSEPSDLSSYETEQARDIGEDEHSKQLSKKPPHHQESEDNTIKSSSRRVSPEELNIPSNPNLSSQIKSPIQSKHSELHHDGAPTITVQKSASTESLDQLAAQGDETDSCKDDTEMDIPFNPFETNCTCDNGDPSNQDILIKISKAQIDKLGQDYTLLKERFNSLQSDHQKLMAVTSELTNAIQTNALGNQSDLKTTLTNCNQIYPELFSYKKECQKCSRTCPVVMKAIESQSDTPYSIDNKNDLQGAVSSSMNSVNKSKTGAKNMTQKNSKALKTVNNKKQPKSLSRQSSMSSLTSNDSYNETLLKMHKKPKQTIDTTAYFKLNYVKIKKDLDTGSPEVKIRLLQSLRWRLTRSTDEIRSFVIDAYTDNDLLGIKQKNSTLEKLCFPSDEENTLFVQQSISRLINTFASLKVGRNYLETNSYVLNEILVPLVMKLDTEKCNIDITTEEMLIATLQKLSLRYSQRIAMIDAGLVEFLIKYFPIKLETISPYCLEYGMALLMNLCLHRKAHDRCESKAEETIEMFKSLLENKYRHCLPYLNGALYSLLSKKAIEQEARRAGLGRKFESLVKKTDGALRKQMEYMVKVMRNPHYRRTKCDCEPGDEPEEEIDFLECELDELDPTTTLSTLPIGENFLHNNYQLSTSKDTEESEESFCETTKQFYKKPSKRGIFDKNKNMGNSSKKKNLPAKSNTDKKEKSETNIVEPEVENYKKTLDNNSLCEKNSKKAVKKSTDIKSVEKTSTDKKSESKMSAKFSTKKSKKMKTKESEFPPSFTRAIPNNRNVSAQSVPSPTMNRALSNAGTQCYSVPLTPRTCCFPKMCSCVNETTHVSLPPITYCHSHRYYSKQKLHDFFHNCNNSHLPNINHCNGGGTFENITYYSNTGEANTRLSRSKVKLEKEKKTSLSESRLMNSNPCREQLNARSSSCGPAVEELVTITRTNIHFEPAPIDKNENRENHDATISPLIVHQDKDSAYGSCKKNKNSDCDSSYEDAFKSRPLIPRTPP